MHYTVTVTRQFGSLGRPIAKEMAEMLGIEYYDRDIVEETASKMDLPVSVVGNEEETAKAGFFKMGYPLGMGTTEKQDQIFRAQASVIRELADKRSCIIVGRCSDYILRNSKNCINIFIYAPYEERLKNCVEILRMDPEEAKRMIAQVDKARDSYHKNFARYLPHDYQHKEIMMDSSLLGVKKTAEVLVNAVKLKFQTD